jgi:hypothetical protein
MTFVAEVTTPVHFLALNCEQLQHGGYAKRSYGRVVNMTRLLECYVTTEQ